MTEASITTATAVSRDEPVGDARLGSSLLLAFALLALLASKSSELLRDPDSQWHVAVGAWIWAHGAVPRVDVFSHTFAGSPWIAKEWLSQLLLFAAHAVAGWRGVALTAAAAFSLAMGSLFYWLSGRVRSTLALLVTLAVTVLFAPHLAARPHLLVLPVVVAWMTGVTGALDRGRSPPFRLVCAMALWANMHGSFPLGLVIAAILAGEGVLMRPAGQRRAATLSWGRFLALAVAATMFSPFGWHALLVSLQMSGNADTLRFVDEWHALRFDTYGVCAVAAMASVVLALSIDARHTFFRILATGCLAYLMVRHVRFISLAGLVSAILAARTIGRWAPVEPVSTSLRRVLPPAVLAMAALAGSVAGLAPADLDPAVTPDAAFAAARAAGVSGRVYNAYDFGGFLIAHGVPTFVDGRTDQLFLHGFLGELVEAVDADDPRPFTTLLRQHEVTWALVKAGSKETRQFAAMPGWTRLYADDAAAVYAVKQP